jgi:hypothetical protein
MLYICNAYLEPVSALQSVFQHSSKKAEKDKPKAIDTMLEKLKKYVPI